MSARSLNTACHVAVSSYSGEVVNVELEQCAECMDEERT